MAGRAPGLTIERIRVGDLPEFARRVLDDPERYAVVPITQRRADSQARNPAASPGDAGLLVASLGGVCVGYLGLLPARVADGRNDRTIYCLSTLYVAPAYRKTGAGSLLLLTAASLGRDLCVVGVSDEALVVLKAMGFRPAGPLVFLRVRIDAIPVVSYALGEARRRLAAGRAGFLGPPLDAARSFLRRFFDRPLRRIVLGRLIRKLRVAGREIEARPITVVQTPPGLPSPARQGRGPRFVRDDGIVNWMIRNPWIGEGPRPRTEYEFSDQRDLFRYLPFELCDRSTGSRLGHAVLSVSSEKGCCFMKLLDRVLVDPEDTAAILALVFREALRWSADVIELPEEFATLLGRTWATRAVTQRGERRHLAYTRDPDGPFGRRLAEFMLDVCDGDAPFV